MFKGYIQWRKILNGSVFKQKSWKPVPVVFYQIFIFSPIDSPSKTMKSVFNFI